MSERQDQTGTPRALPRRRVVDGLLLGRHGLWGVVARPDGDDADLFTEAADQHVAAPLKVCRSVRADGTVVIGDADPSRDLWLSELMLWECCDEV